MSSNTPPYHHNFLTGGGEMGELIRTYPWHTTSLGPPEHWPQSLKTIVRIILSTGHPMFVWWGPALIQFYNDAYRRSLGPERHPSALGMSGEKCWAEIWPLIGPQIEYVMAGKGHTWDENRLVPTTRHGKIEDVYWTYSYGPIDEPSAPNGTGGVLVVCSETTELVLAERRHYHAEQRWRRLFDQATGFICILKGADHVFEYANPKYFQLVGRQDIIGKPIAAALPEVEDQGFVTLLNKVFSEGLAHSGTAIPVKLFSTQTNCLEQRFVDFVYQPIFDDNNQVEGIHVDGYDVTERVLIARQMQVEEKRKDEFLAMLAHELRNPLAPIRNTGEWLIRTSNKHPEQKVAGEMVSRQISHLTHLVDDLLDISRITRGKIILQRQVISLAEILAHAIDIVRSEAQAKGLNIHWVPGSDDAFINGDPTRVTQCMVNVLNNAVKYSEQGTVTVALVGQGEKVEVQVSDQGIGIEPAKLDAIFELFVQADNSLDRARGGLGIGLSLVKIITEMHGGTVEVSSDGLGLGARFTLSFPAVSPPTSAEPAAIIDKARSRTVLVVDDNRDAALSLKQLLQLEDHEVSVAFTSADALACFAKHEVEVVLLDIGLPDIDGYELAMRMREGGYQGLLIATTGYGQLEDVRKAMAAGFDHHMIKPIEFPSLLRLLQEGG